MVQSVAVLQCVAVCYIEAPSKWIGPCLEYDLRLVCVAVCCNVLQCVTTCCNVLQHVVVCCSVLQRVAVCCTEFAFRT